MQTNKLPALGVRVGVSVGWGQVTTCFCFHTAHIMDTSMLSVCYKSDIL